jgi:hypothetical protein
MLPECLKRQKNPVRKGHVMRMPDMLSSSNSKKEDKNDSKMQYDKYQYDKECEDHEILM